MAMRDVVIVSAVRTPTGRFLGGLRTLPAPELGAVVVAEAVRRAGIDPALVDECILGNVLAAGTGQAPARQAALKAGLANTVGALTINKVCGSGLKAVMLATHAIGAGDADTIVAGGMESMSKAPYLLTGAREGYRMGHGSLVDSVLLDGLWCAFEQWHMGEAAEATAESCGITRADQDRYAAESHQKAAHAAASGWFDDEIVPVEVAQRKGPAQLVRTDESIRPETTDASLSALSPAFRPGGTVTAGNAPPLSDGAAALLVMASERASALGLRPMARVVAQATTGRAPKDLLMTPVDAVRRVLDRSGWSLDDVGLLEVNEAFSAQAVAVLRELGVPPERVNVHGGAVALGHPIGASGARILTTLLHAMRRRAVRRGIATLCLGGGNGVALAVESV